MAGDITPFTGLITSEHNQQPDYMAMVGASLQPFADLIAEINTINALYDVDSAVGEQLDVVGEWVGVSRNLQTPLTGVYFAFDTANLGFDQGIWLGPFDPVSGLVQLPDDFYRLLIKAKILNNSWLGDIPSAYTIGQNVFSSLGYFFFIEDHADLTIAIGLVGPGVPSPVAFALLTQGYLDLRPAGIEVTAYITQSQAGPIFAFDLNTTQFAGFDQGGWATLTP